MARPPSDHDPFDLGFEAADEFTSAGADPWRSSAPALTPAMGGLDDPFADFPPARPRDERPSAAQDPFAAPAAARQAQVQTAAPARAPAPAPQPQPEVQRAPAAEAALAAAPEPFAPILHD
ncbi:MAG: hypothetical protein B7X77_07825, partial [Caulobacter sp. 39-67-4]